MHRRSAALLAALFAAVLLVGVAAVQRGDDAPAQVDAGASSADLASAVSAAQVDMPIPVSNSRVGVLLEDLCHGGDGVGAQLGALRMSDAAQAGAVLDALAAGTEVLCPGGVDPAAETQARAAAQALAEPPAVAPSATVVDAAPDASGPVGRSGAGTGGSTSAASSSSASGDSSSTSGTAADQSTGTAQAGGGNATGAGNRSSTGFSQSLGGGGASNTADAG
jgi:hypothetical protein